MYNDFPSPPQVPAGHVALILTTLGDKHFYLQIPLSAIRALCTHPRLYLLYLGVYITGVGSGFVAVEDPGNWSDIGGQGNLADQGVYRYVAFEDDAPTYLLSDASVDIVVVARSTTAITSGQRRISFTTLLEARDSNCVFTGGLYYDGIHFIPNARGDACMENVIEHRPVELDDPYSTTISGIDDIRNGLLTNTNIHRAIDGKTAAVLKTPNRVLTTNHVQPRHQRALLPGTAYPTTSRYTLQWLDDRPIVRLGDGQNVDAAFRTNAQLAPPADVILHYTYCTAVIQRWGKNVEILEKNPFIIHPPSPPPRDFGAPKIPNDRKSARRKLRQARKESPEGSDEDDEPAEDSEEEDEADQGATAAEYDNGYDVDGISAVSGGETRPDPVMWFWKRNPEVRVRKEGLVREFNNGMNEWREGVAIGTSSM